MVQRSRRIASLDFDLDAPMAHLSCDPVLAPLLAARPGVRPPGTWDPFETGVRAILGQQVSVAGASTLTGRVAARFGAMVPGLAPMGLSHTFPGPEVLADADLSGLGLTGARQQAVGAFARGVAERRRAPGPQRPRSTSWWPPSPPSRGSGTGRPTISPSASASPTPSRPPTWASGGLWRPTIARNTSRAGPPRRWRRAGGPGEPWPPPICGPPARTAEPAQPAGAGVAPGRAEEAAGSSRTAVAWRGSFSVRDPRRH